MKALRIFVLFALSLAPLSALSAPPHYDWRGSYCAEIPPYGSIIRYVQEFYCR